MTIVRVMSMIVLLVGIFLSGYWLSHVGKPVNVIILTIHKLVSLAAVALLALTIVQAHRIASLNTPMLVMTAATGVFFLVTIATGGWLSAGKAVPTVILRLHQIVPFLTACSTAVTLYLLFTRK